MPTKRSKADTSQGSQIDVSGQALQQIANCLGYLVTHSDELKGKANKDLIPILSSLGFDRNAIASILQTTPETVSVRLSQLKATASNKSSSKPKVEVDADNLQNNEAV